MENRVLSITIFCLALWIAHNVLAATGPEQAAQRETVAVIGTGMVGSAIGPRMAELGFVVVYGSRDPERAKVRQLVERTGASSSAMSSIDAMQMADIIMLAVPWEAVESLIKNGGDLSGKLIIDITNPMTLGDDGYFYHPLDKAGAIMIQEWSPSAMVVKAFSTVGSFAMADISSAGGPVTAIVAADDRVAKCRVMEIADELGFETSDAGPLRHAKILEDMTMLYMVAFSHGTIATASSELHIRKNDNYKKLIAAMDEEEKPAWARGETIVSDYKPCN